MPRITFDPDTSRGAGGNGERGISEETIQDKPDTGKGMGRGKSTDSGTGAPAAQQPQRPEAADVVRGGLYADRTFTRLDGAVRDFVQAEFEHCTFAGCDFSYADLSHAFFSECLFRECRMVVPGLSAVHLRKAVFDGCLLSGLDFGQCVKAGFGVSFVRSRLDNCSFYELKMPGTRFDDCELTGCLFAESDLTGASFDGCKLPATDFDRCRLERADFRTATEFAIDPGRNMLRRAKFSPYNLAGLLAVYGIEIG